MALLRRLTRTFDTLSRQHLDGRSLYGARGEEYASQFLEGPAILSRVTNPLIPASGTRRYPLEADFLVSTQGNLFCIEVKRYKGRITSGVGPSGNVDDSVIVQERIGRYGERLPPRTHPNPLKKTRSFIHQLKTFLGETVDARFRGLFIIAVVAFVEEADIRAISDAQAGIIAVRDLPAFFHRHAHPTFARTPSSWIVEGLQRVPTSDLIVTTDEEPFKGFLADEALVFERRDGGTERSGLFSDVDTLTVHLIDGQVQTFAAARGSVRMTDFQGRLQAHTLRNIVRIVVGGANKRG
jgi:hypothetical protein